MIFKLHAETPVVQGYLRSCVYDLPRQAHDFLPPEVAVRLQALDGAALATLDSELDEEDKKWLDYVLEKEYGFTIAEQFKDCFPAIDFTWTHPSTITNAIIDIDITTAVLDFSWLEQLNCKHLLLRFSAIDDLEAITAYLKNALADLTFKSVDIIVEKTKRFSRKAYTSFGKRLLKEVVQVTNLLYYEPQAEGMFIPHFVINIDVFAEAQQHHAFFNRKLYITAHGDIHNGIEHPHVYGNIRHLAAFEDLEALVGSAAYQALWHTPKDHIDVCRDCEFRYMCIDNRLPRRRADGSLYYEAACAYNPYIARWHGEEHYASLEETGVSVTAAGFALDKDRVAEVIERVWG